MGFRFLFFFVFFICTMNAYGTPSDSLKIKKRKSSQYFSFQMGLTNSNLYGSELDLQLSNPGAYFESKNGLSFDLKFKNEFTDFFYVKTGFVVVQKKGYVRNTTFVYPVSADLNFIQIPLMIGIQPINFKNAKYVKLSVESGIALTENAGSTDSLEKGLHPDNTVYRNSSITSFLMGVNLDILLTKKCALQASYTYAKDLSYYFSRTYKWLNWNTNQYVYSTYDVWVKSETFSVGLAYKISAI